MHAAIAVLAILAEAAATPSPTPTTPAADTVTPGPWGFAVVAFVAIAVIFLLWDMLRRIRRGRYRAQVREELDAEQAESGDAQPTGDPGGDRKDAAGHDDRT